MNVLKLWFSFDGPVGRKAYVLSGVALMAMKYLVDAGIVYATKGHLLTLFEFLSPLMMTRDQLLGRASEGALLAMTVLALPFLWIGVSMSVRRAVDAGISPWVGLLFVLPFLNFLVMLALALTPTRSVAEWKFPATEVAPGDDKLKSAMFGFLIGLGIAALMTGTTVLFLEEYTMVLFFATPFAMGAAAGYVYNRPIPRGIGGTIFVGAATICVASGALLLFALEGIVCIAMSLPITGAAGVLGALVGRAIGARGGRAPAHLWPLVLALPITSAMAGAVPIEKPEREVITAIEIDAPPEVVWRNVIGFSELPPPPEIVFKLGVSYPKRAVIDGEGPGALRRCEFSTGPFVEPITRWEPPSRLSFDVTSQPPPMEEWSPYRHVHAPHLDGYLLSKRGEFRLVRLPGDRTRLEGSTWYTLDLYPERYWALWSDALIHQIHLRVLKHIRGLSTATSP